MFETRTTLTAALLVLWCMGCAAPPEDPRDATPDLDVEVTPEDMPAEDLPDASVSDMMLYRATGSICSSPVECAPIDLCTAAGDSTFRCLRLCDTAYTLCEGGEVCTPLDNLPARVCYPGGRVPERRPCEVNLDCERGNLCLGRPGERYCIAACDASTSDGCEEAQECVALEEKKGYCRDVVGRGCGACGEVDLSCSTDLGSERVDALFPEGVCTTSGCTSDTDCPGDASCRVYEEGQPGLCVDRCAGDADCRFTRGYRCLGILSCETLEGFEGCETFFGPELLCVQAP